MDDSNTVLIVLYLSKQEFKEYRCDKQIILNLSVEHLVKVLRCGKNEDSLTLSCKENPSVLNIKFENTSKN